MPCRLLPSDSGPQQWLCDPSLLEPLGEDTKDEGLYVGRHAAVLQKEVDLELFIALTSDA
jgi:hypothetical protein